MANIVSISTQFEYAIAEIECLNMLFVKWKTTACLEFQLSLIVLIFRNF